MSDTTETPAKVLDRIRGLLAKAERTDNTHEAEAFAAKAAELMDRYRVDVATIRGTGHARYTSHRYHLGQHRYLRASRQLLLIVAQHYDVLVGFPATGNSKWPTMFGDESDITATLTIFESLVIQRDRAAVRAGSGTRYRTSFAYGYAARIHARLTDLRRAAEAAARDTGDTMALEVYDRRAGVKAWLADEHGLEERKDGLNAPRVTADGIIDGDAAAASADLGVHERLEGDGRKAIGS